MKAVKVNSQIVEPVLKKNDILSMTAADEASDQEGLMRYILYSELGAPVERNDKSSQRYAGADFTKEEACQQWVNNGKRFIRLDVCKPGKSFLIYRKEELDGMFDATKLKPNQQDIISPDESLSGKSTAEKTVAKRHAKNVEEEKHEGFPFV